MLCLSIETSCDETSVALISRDKGLLSLHTYSQLSHTDYGGVVPELASRDHLSKITHLAEKALLEASLRLSDIDAFAYTAGPGLVGALLVGAKFAQTLSATLKKPCLAINHLEGHLASILLGKEGEAKLKTLSYLDQFNQKCPFLALLVSGGHTQLIEVESFGTYRLIGESLDDAVGEAFDKTAQVLGLGFPGGAALSQLAAEVTQSSIEMTVAMKHSNDCNFSFSGLKTQAKQLWQASDKSDTFKKELAFAFEKAAIDSLWIKCKKALQSKPQGLIVVGGVCANRRLREFFKHQTKALATPVDFPSLEFSGDNAAMIGLCALMQIEHIERIKQAEGTSTSNVHFGLNGNNGNFPITRSRWPLEDLSQRFIKL